jgi:hypothetical protein
VREAGWRGGGRWGREDKLNEGEAGAQASGGLSRGRGGRRRGGQGLVRSRRVRLERAAVSPLCAPFRHAKHGLRARPMDIRECERWEGEVAGGGDGLGRARDGERDGRVGPLRPAAETGVPPERSDGNNLQTERLKCLSPITRRGFGRGCALQEEGVGGLGQAVVHASCCTVRRKGAAGEGRHERAEEGLRQTCHKGAGDSRLDVLRWGGRASGLKGLHWRGRRVRGGRVLACWA